MPYLNSLLDVLRELPNQPSPWRTHLVDVVHDSDCPFVLSGEPCTCAAEIYVDGERKVPNAE